MKKIKDDAKKISDILIETNTDVRGNLFLEVFNNLVDEGQGFTASLFLQMSSEYGVKLL